MKDSILEAKDPINSWLSRLRIRLKAKDLLPQGHN